MSHSSFNPLCCFHCSYVKSVVFLIELSQLAPSCEAKEDQGPCDGLFPRWFYRTSTQTCEQFMYGGCLGNGNNFVSKEDCESGCGELYCIAFFVLTFSAAVRFTLS